MSEIDENRIYQEFTKGSHLAFEKIFKSNYQQIVGFCTQFIYDKDESKSLAQEAFIKLWQNRDKIEKIGGIKSFLYTSAKSDCLNFIRHKKVENRYQNRQLDLEEQHINMEVLESFEFESMEYSEMEKLLDKSVENLPDKARTVFIKSRFEGKTNKEIAAGMNISVKSVEANMTRALKTLRINLSEFLPLILVELILRH